MTPPFPDLFVLLTGGRGQRLGGLDKASIEAGGESLFDRAVRAALGRPVIVVGPERAAARAVTFAREDPPGGGPAAGLAAGVVAASRLGLQFGSAQHDCQESGPLVAVLAVDQVGVIPGTFHRLTAAATISGGAVLIAHGHRQYGAGVYSLASLLAAIATQPSWHDMPLRVLLDPIVGSEVDALGDESRDIDTLEDLHWWTEHAKTLSEPDGASGRANDEGDHI